MFKFSLCILFVAPSLINYSRPCGQVEGARVWRSPLDIWTFRASWIRIAWLQIVTCLNFWEKVAHKQFNLNIKNDHLIMLRKRFGLILFFFWSELFSLMTRVFARVCLYGCIQGGRTWQPFVGGKNGHENFCQAHIYNFYDECVVFVCNRTKSA